MHLIISINFEMPMDRCHIFRSTQFLTLEINPTLAKSIPSCPKFLHTYLILSNKCDSKTPDMTFCC